MASRPSGQATEELLFNLSAYAVAEDSVFRATDLEALLAVALVGRFRTIINLSYTDSALYGLAVQGVVTHLSSVLQRLGWAPAPDSVQCIAAPELSVLGAGALNQEFLYRSAGPEGSSRSGGSIRDAAEGGGDAPGAELGSDARSSVPSSPLPVLLIHSLQAIEFTERALYGVSDAIRAACGPVVAICTSEELPYPLVELFDLSLNCLTDEVALPIPCTRRPAAEACRPSWTSLHPERVGVSLGLQSACTEFLLRLTEVHLTALVGDEEVVSEGPRMMVEAQVLRFARCRAALEGRQFCKPQDLTLGILCAVPHQLRLMPVLQKAELPSVTKKLVYRKTCRLLEELLKAWF